MMQALSRVDDLLRSPSDMIPDTGWAGLGRLAVIAAGLAAIYAFFVGWYAVRVHGWEGLAHIVSVIVKLPTLFFMTLLVTGPSLYVFSTLLGSPLQPKAMSALALRATCVLTAVAGSLGPIVGFFTLSTDNYPFMVLLTVAFLGIAGLCGTASLYRMLRAAFDRVEPAGYASARAGPDAQSPATPRPDLETNPGPSAGAERSRDDPRVGSGGFA